MVSPTAAPTPKVSQLQVHGVYALSTPSKAVLAACPTAEHLCATAASSFAVIHDTNTNQQVKQLRSTTSNHSLLCLAWSCCGTHLAAGQAGSNPSILIWDVTTGQCVRELKGHKSAVARLCFSPDGKLLASVGSAADGHLCIWDWHTGSLLCRQKVAADLTSAAFTEDSSHILAAGKGTLKSWSISWSTPPAAGRSRSSGGGVNSADASSTGLTLVARQVNLKQQRSGTFVDLCLAPCLPGQPVGSNGLYALTDKGHLLLLRSTGRTVDRSINLQVQEAFGLAATARLVACACSRGTVRLFSSKTLAFRANLPYWTKPGQDGTVDSRSFADARGCTFGPGSHADSLLLVVYSNHDIILWDIHDLAHIHPVRSFASHTGCIWDVCALSVPHTSTDDSAGQDGVHGAVSGCATCAADGAVRFWELTKPSDTLKPLCGVETGGVSALQPAGSRVQLRCMRVSHDGQLLAAGDSSGNVHVYDVATLKLLVVQEAHDSEVLCLDFSLPPLAVPQVATEAGSSQGAAICSSSMLHSRGSKDGRGLAASGSRDMLIHVYDAYNGFRLLETLAEHEADVTAVRFTSSGRGLVSCAADHSIIFRVFGRSGGPWGYKVALRETLPHSLLYDIVVDPLDAYVLTTDQDGMMRQWDATTGAVLRVMEPQVGAGQVMRMCMDPGGVMAICCHSDGCVRLYDLKSGLLMWRGWGHAAFVAAAAVLPCLSQLVSVGGDGCMVVWQLPDTLAAQLQAAAAQVAAVKQQEGSAAASIASPIAAAAAVGSGACTPAPHQGTSGLDAAAASASITPGSCTSDSGGMSSTLRRLKEGKPLVSADKLPRWARSPSCSNSSGQHSSDGGAGGQRLQGPLPGSKWRWPPLAAAAGQTGVDGQAAAAMSDPGAQDAAHGTGQHSPHAQASADTLAMVAVPAQQQAGLPWHGDGGRALIRNWPDGSTFSKEAAAIATATAAAATAAAAAAEASSSTSPEDHCSQPEDFATPASEQQPDLPNKAQVSPAAQGAGAVVKDLFKSHFSSPQQPKAQQPADDDDCLTVQQDRQSFSAKFKRERSSLSQLSSPVADTAATPFKAADTAAEASSSPGTAEHSTGLTPQGSKLFRVASNQPPAPAPSPAATPLAGAAAAADDRAAQDRPVSQEPSPREKRWRQGQMNSELAGMRERLETLQALYQQQQQQPRASPVRPKSSLGHTSPTPKQLRINRRRSDSSAGGAPIAPAVHQQQQEQQQPHSPCRQQQQQQQRPQLQLPKSPKALQPAAASPSSPTRPSLQRLLAVTGKGGACSSSTNNSNRQPWASPSAAVSAKAPNRSVRCSPAGSPPPGARRQQQPAPHAGKGAHEPAGSNEAGPVFGSRTLARSLHRRRSSAAEEGTAAGAAAATAATPQHGNSAGMLPSAPAAPSTAEGAAVVVAGLSPVAAEPASPAARPAKEDRSLLAALLADDSPAPTPAATAPPPTLAGEDACSAQEPQTTGTGDNGSAQQDASGPPVGAGTHSDASPGAALAAASTPTAPNTTSRLAALLAWDGSPEAASPLQLEQHPAASPSGPAAAAAASPSSSCVQVLHSPTAGASSPALVQQLRLAEVLRQSSNSPSLEPSDSSSPDKQQLRSPLTSSCSPQQRHAGQPPLQPGLRVGSPNSMVGRRVLELEGRLDVSSECRVSIGTSIAARSPAKTVAAGGLLSHALSVGLSEQSSNPASDLGCVAAAASTADATGCDGSGAPADVRCSSVDLTPAPAADGFAAEDTPKASLGGVLMQEGAGAIAAAAAAAASSWRQQMVPALPVEVAGVPSKAGVTVTPAGNTEVWPAWGPEGAWAATPSPAPATARSVEKVWVPHGPSAAASPEPDADCDGSQHNSMTALDAAAVAAAVAAAAGSCSQATDNAAAGSAAGSTATGDASQSLPGCGSEYWITQNPCYDMTPQGSAGRRSSRGQEGLITAADLEAARCFDGSRPCSPNQQQAGEEAGGDLCAGGVVAAALAAQAAEPSAAVAAAVAAADAGSSRAASDALEGGSRYCSFTSAVSSPASAGGIAEHPATPGSACDSSQPGSEPGSRSGSKRHSSAGGRFGSRGLHSLLGQGSSQPGSEGSGRPCSPGTHTGMLGLLQRMKMTLPSRRTKSGSSAGGCMSPQVRLDDDGDSSRPGRAPYAASNRQQQQQPYQAYQQASWSCTADSVASADDVQLEVSSRDSVSAAHSPAAASSAAPSIQGRSTATRGAVTAVQPKTAAQLAATVDRFKHSMLEMQQLLQQMHSLSLDVGGEEELDRLLTPPYQQQQAVLPGGRAGIAWDQQQEARSPHPRCGTQAEQQQQAGSTCSSNSSSHPAASLQHRLQQEVLHSISELHATITGVPLAVAAPAMDGTSESSPSTPAWIAAAGSSQQLRSQHHQQQPPMAASPASSSYQAGPGPSGGSSCESPAAALAQALSAAAPGAGDPQVMEELATQVCHVFLRKPHLLKKLDLQVTGMAAPPAGDSKGGAGRLRRTS